MALSGHITCLLVVRPLSQHATSCHDARRKKRLTTNTSKSHIVWCRNHHGANRGSIRGHAEPGIKPQIQQGMQRPVFSYKLRNIVGFGLVEMAISTNPKPTIYRNLYENTDSAFILQNICFQ